MATYEELFDLRSSNSALRNKISVAITKKAQSLIDESSSTSAEIEWAKDAIENPRSKATTLLNYVLAKNSDLTVSQIEGASDTAIQSQIDAAVDALIAGGA